MIRTTIVAGALVTALVALVFVVRQPAREQDGTLSMASLPVPSADRAVTESAGEDHSGFLYGRITDVDGDTYEGRLRWGGTEEAFWSDSFDGAKQVNPWAVHAPRDTQAGEGSFEIFGIRIGGADAPTDLSRRLMVPFGEIVRIVAHFRDVQVTLKSGTVVELDRFSAGDIDDGVRVWDGRRGVVDLDARRIRTIEFLPTAPLLDVPRRLHGTVRARQGDFTGFIQWDRQDGMADDALDGRTAEGDLSLRYDTIRSIARRSNDSVTVALTDGREIVLSDNREVGRDNRGIYVDDPRYGRVLVSWDAFEQVVFSPSGSGPAYGDFPSGRPLAGSVTTRDGRRLVGRLVYDFDESETTETLDAPSQGVDYFIPFGLIASIVRHDQDARGGARRGTVILHDGEALPLERTGDLGDGNAGVLIFADGAERPEYVPWANVEQIDFDRTPVP